ncbi:MAG: bifunctional DNA-formamidopyrimidine glycosylase/DNA-(apurinic or apyrimidinic site) lyase [Candidatus Nanosyncoccaceae bacterium]|jgi:formamidopyrimidine-DNA glycosylase
MPELPEVETIRRGLGKILPAKIVESAYQIESPKSFPNPDSEVRKFLIGSEIVAVRRRAKVLMIDLSSKYSLVIHLKMTGQLIYIGEERWGGGHPTDSLVGELPDRSTRVVIKFTDGSVLYFNDQRKFGWVRLMPTILIPDLDFMKKVGPEPLEDEFTATDFIKRIRRRQNTTIKAAILDQTILAGVGNIYADESLWGAKIHPATRVRDVSDTELKALLREIKYVMQLAIDNGGSTYSNYVNAAGEKGNYLADFARVFRREGQICLKCGTEIKKIRVAGRGTHFCPKCQLEIK